MDAGVVPVIRKPPRTDIGATGSSLPGGQRASRADSPRSPRSDRWQTIAHPLHLMGWTLRPGGGPGPPAGRTTVPAAATSVFRIGTGPSGSAGRFRQGRRRAAGPPGRPGTPRTPGAPRNGFGGGAIPARLLGPGGPLPPASSRFPACPDTPGLRNRPAGFIREHRFERGYDTAARTVPMDLSASVPAAPVRYGIRCGGAGRTGVRRMCNGLPGQPAFHHPSVSLTIPRSDPLALHEGTADGPPADAPATTDSATGHRGSSPLPPVGVVDHPPAPIRSP